MPLHRTRLMGRSLIGILAHVPTTADRARFLTVYTDLTRRAALGQPGREHRVRVRFGTTVRDWHVADIGEVWALAEVIVASHYGGPRLPPAASVVVDIGANVGAAAAWFRARYPSAQVVAVEPDPATFALLQKNVGDDPMVHLVRAAVSDHDGELFLSREGMSVLTRVRDQAPPDGSGTAVRCFSIPSLMEHVGIDAPIDLLKIDAEGGEWKILESPLPPVGAVVMEVHEFDGGESADDRLARIAEREGMQLSHGGPRDIRWLTAAGV